MLAQALQTAHQMYGAGHRTQALNIVKELAVKFPEEPMPVYMLASWLIDDGQDHLALPMLRDALTLAPDNSEMWANLGGVYKKNEHRAKAVECYQKALSLEPDFPAALKGLAGAYVNQGNPNAGLSYARRALQFDGPHQPAARNDLALLLLEAGHWEEGFREYRHRDQLPMFHVRNYGDVPRWDGKKIGTLAVHAEQGLGDEILFASCLADLAPLADKIVGECNGRLIELFRRSFPNVTWFATHEDLMASGIKLDAWERMGDLPGWFRKKPSDCPGTAFLKADPAKVAGYRARLQAIGSGPYIGFAWLGGTSGTHRQDRRAPRAMWTELVQRASGVKVSLQYGEDGARHASEWGLHHWPSVIDDLDETAALIMALDVVVSSPQTAIHIAGALGQRCLVPMSARPAWRYQLSGPMPWYRSVELIRQKGEDWSSVFRVIDASLADLVRLRAA
jgi:hypothetical protein